MKKNIKSNILVGILITLAIIGTSNFLYIGNNDEFWTFANTYKLYNGISLYNENNVIHMPLFFWTGSLVFKIFGANFLVYRIYHLVIMFILYLAIYKLFINLNIKKEISILMIAILSILFRSVNTAGGSYTTLALAMFVLGVSNLIKAQNKNTNIIFQGIIAFLIFITKQNVGVYYILGLIIYLMSGKNRIKNIITLIVTITIPSCIFLGYEYYNNELENLINYTFLGLGEFAEKNIILDSTQYVQMLLAIPISAIISAIYQFRDNKKKNIKDEKFKILVVFSIMNLFMAYPIFNKYHILTSIVISAVLLIYILYVYIKKIKLEQEAKKIILGTINKLIVIFIIVFAIRSIYNVIVYNEFINPAEIKYDRNHPFYGGVIYKGSGEVIEGEPEYDDVMNFIKEKENESDVIIFDTRANLYMVPLGRNNQNYDLPMLGNWGKDGENKLLGDVKSKTNTYFLLYDETRNISTQESKKIKDYIKENSRYDGKIGKYDIYYKY